MAYTVVISKDVSHFNILVNKSTKTRVFTPTSILYRCLDAKNDVVENISKMVTKMQGDEVIKSIQMKGREDNKNLRKAAFQVFDELRWDQDKFDVANDFVSESSYERIPDELKFQYTDIIEEAFYTTGDRVDFYKFIRNYTDGNIKSKEHMTELLKDMLLGLKIDEQF